MNAAHILEQTYQLRNHIQNGRLAVRWIAKDIKKTHLKLGGDDEMMG